MRLPVLRRSTLFISLAAALLTSAARPDERYHTRPNFKDPDAIAAVESGRSTVANAAWWGFNPDDGTAAIQAAIDSGAATVIIPYMGMDWNVRPLILASDQEIIIEPGVVVTAKQGAFRGDRDALLSGTGVRDVTITGHGAVLRMRKTDYAARTYSNSGTRHALALYGVQNVYVAGLTLQSSGGDGIYVGPTLDSRRTPSEDIVIEDCVCNDNLRHGLSIVSARNVVVENCTFRNTMGSSPEAGLEVEPGSDRDVIANVEVRSSSAVNNKGAGFVASFSRLKSTSAPVSLRFVDCRVLDTRQSGFRALLQQGANPSGTVDFINCTSEGSEYAGNSISWNAAAALKLRFEDCKWRRAALRSSQAPLDIRITGSGGGGVQFTNCYIYDDKKRNPIRFVDLSSSAQSTAVSGQIHFINGELESDGEFTSAALPRLTVQHFRQQR